MIPIADWPAALAGAHEREDLHPSDGDVLIDRTAVTVPAAVLIAITDRPEPGLILTTRQEGLRRHAGQIAFPGGRADPGDRDAVDTALREALEEIALPPPRVEVIGTLPDYHTVTGYAITPVVGLVPPDLPLIAQPGEVADIFELPLAHALDPAMLAERTVEWQGAIRPYREIMWEERRIWGATAAMLANLSKLVWRR